MAKGYEAHKDRENSLQRFGKELVRRSKSRCELCEKEGVALKIFEVPPVPKSPVYEHCLFLCSECIASLDKPLKFIDHWRCLNSAVWSEVSAIQVLAVTILKEIAENEEWAGDLLDQVYLSEDSEKWLEKI